MLETQLNHRGVLRAAEDVARILRSRPTIVRELDELARSSKIESTSRRGPAGPRVAARTAPTLFAARDRGRRRLRRGRQTRCVSLQTGILKLKDTNRELLFVTLDKSGKGFSPTTRYRDYAMSPELFHWETQAAASVSRPSGRRYVESATNGWSFFLFVRTDPDASFAFLGPITLRVTYRRSPDRDHVAARQPDARRPLRPLRHAAPGLTTRNLAHCRVCPRLACVWSWSPHVATS